MFIHNQVQIYNQVSGEADFESSGPEEDFGEEELQQPGFPVPFNAYSGTGDAQVGIFIMSIQAYNLENKICNP